MTAHFTPCCGMCTQGNNHCVPILQSVNKLAMETRRLVKCNHSRKTAAFIRACAAYSFITIPSLENKLSALNLYLLSGRVAIANGALSQGKQLSETLYQFMVSFTIYNFIYNTDYNIMYSRTSLSYVRMCSQLSKTGMCPIVIII